MWFIYIVLLILILGIIILVHELGHFLWAKKFGVYIYEFSIGFGKVLWSKKGKDGVLYNLRLFPIGGFVQMAGEVYEDDKKIPKEKFMCNKPWYQRIIIIVAGVVNNFILAFVVLFVIALIWGAPSMSTKIKSVKEDYPVALSGIVAGDEIIKINGYKISSWDVAQLVLYFKDKDNVYTFTIKHSDGTIDDYKITPTVEKDGETERKVFGIEMPSDISRGFVSSLKYAFNKFGSIYKSMVLTIYGLFSGNIGINALSGPVGMYDVVGTSVKSGIENVIYLVGFLSLNVGFINILPFPAFDGGRVLFLIIEKIKGSPVNSKFENTCHTIGFFLLLALMLYITVLDIIRLF